MRELHLLAVLCLLALGAFARGDDLSALRASCGTPADDKIHAPSEYEDGLWHRTVEYSAGGAADDWMVVGFTAKSKHGPWKYQDSMFKKLPCLASSGIVAEAQAQTVVTPAVSHPSSDNGASAFLGFTLITLALIAYIFPMAVALHRHCKATAGIVVVNLFLGWTFVGWVVALAWAASGEKVPRPAAPVA